MLLKDTVKWQPYYSRTCFSRTIFKFYRGIFKCYLSDLTKSREIQINANTCSVLHHPNVPHFLGWKEAEMCNFLQLLRKIKLNFMDRLNYLELFAAVVWSLFTYICDLRKRHKLNSIVVKSYELGIQFISTPSELCSSIILLWWASNCH